MIPGVLANSKSGQRTNNVPVNVLDNVPPNRIVPPLKQPSPPVPEIGPVNAMSPLTTTKFVFNVTGPDQLLLPMLVRTEPGNSPPVPNPEAINGSPTTATLRKVTPPAPSVVLPEALPKALAWRTSMIPFAAMTGPTKLLLASSSNADSPNFVKPPKPAISPLNCKPTYIEPCSKNEWWPAGKLIRPKMVGEKTAFSDPLTIFWLIVNVPSG